RRLPGRMTANADRHRSDVVLDPCAFHARSRGLQLKRFLIKLSRAFLVGHGDGDECNFLDHGHGSFAFSGFNLWIINLLPSGSCTTAMWQHGLSNGSAANGTCRSFNRAIASSKFSISIATLVPSADGFHWSPALPIARVLFPTAYSIHSPPPISSPVFNPRTPS